MKFYFRVCTWITLPVYVYVLPIWKYKMNKTHLNFENAGISQRKLPAQQYIPSLTITTAPSSDMWGNCKGDSTWVEEFYFFFFFVSKPNSYCCLNYKYPAVLLESENKKFSNWNKCTHKKSKIENEQKQEQKQKVEGRTKKKNNKYGIFKKWQKLNTNMLRIIYKFIKSITIITFQ